MSAYAHTEPAVYQYADNGNMRFHVLMGERLVMNLSALERDRHLAAHSEGRIYSTPQADRNPDRNPTIEEGFTTYLDDNFSIKYDADQNTASIRRGAVSISHDAAFAKWLLPILEARGFTPHWVKNPTHRIGIGIVISGCVAFVAILMLMLANTRYNDPDNDIMIRLLGAMGDKLGPAIILIAAVLIILNVLWLSLDFNVREKKIFILLFHGGNLK